MIGESPLVRAFLGTRRMSQRPLSGRGTIVRGREWQTETSARLPRHRVIAGPGRANQQSASVAATEGISDENKQSVQKLPLL
jgi:hypothetical protein